VHWSVFVYSQNTAKPEKLQNWEYYGRKRADA